MEVPNLKIDKEFSDVVRHEKCIYLLKIPSKHHKNRTFLAFSLLFGISERVISSQSQFKLF